MIPLLYKRPDLRCEAKARRSGWQRCKRVKAYSQRVCQSHGAQKNRRFGKDNPNYRHGEFSESTKSAARETRQELRTLSELVDYMIAWKSEFVIDPGLVADELRMEFKEFIRTSKQEEKENA